jgi:hypothetical protein
MERRVFGCS